jgi:hypothetical protein
MSIEDYTGEARDLRSILEDFVRPESLTGNL